MAKEYKDTLTPRALGIAKRVLSSPLAEFLHPHTRAGLQEVLDGKDARFGSYSLLNVEFRRADTNITLTVRCEGTDWRSDNRDAEGNEWNEYKLWTELNWPCHGSCGPTLAIARNSFYRQVIELAADIEADFCQSGYRNEVFRMGRTAAQLQKEKEEQEARKLHSLVVAAIEKKKHGMRVGSERDLGANENFAGIPVGRYEHEFNDGKKYSLQVTDIGAFINRWS